MTRVKHTSQFIFLILFPLIFVLPALGQNPVASRGIQLLAISEQECIERAQKALLAEGYTFLTSSKSFGGKNIHTAGILCNAAPDGKMWVNIFVASTHNDPTVPGAERERLQARMDRSAGTPEYIDWGRQPNQIEGRQIGSRYTFTCKPGGPTSGRLWGTDLYTDDSSICLAAAHAGLISTSDGGTVTIEIRAGAQAYNGSTRYGIGSSGYGGWGGSFVFVR